MSTRDDQPKMLPEGDELEQLLTDLAPTEHERELLLEEHRQLEKDLLRLSDPLPPPDFVQLVMAKVAVAPAPLPTRSEIISAVAIGSGSLIAALVALLGGGNNASTFGLALAQMLVRAREQALGLMSAFFAVWRTTALPLSVGLAALLLISIFALRRVGTLSPSEARAMS